MLIGYMRVSKQDGSQCLDLQRDALLAAGVNSERVFEYLDSGRGDGSPKAPGQALLDAVVNSVNVKSL